MATFYDILKENPKRYIRIKTNKDYSLTLRIGYASSSTQYFSKRYIGELRLRDSILETLIGPTVDKDPNEFIDELLKTWNL